MNGTQIMIGFSQNGQLARVLNRLYRSINAGESGSSWINKPPIHVFNYNYSLCFIRYVSTHKVYSVETVSFLVG